MQSNESSSFAVAAVPSLLGASHKASELSSDGCSDNHGEVPLKRPNLGYCTNLPTSTAARPEEIEIDDDNKGKLFLTLCVTVLPLIIFAIHRATNQSVC